MASNVESVRSLPMPTLLISDQGDVNESNTAMTITTDKNNSVNIDCNTTTCSNNSSPLSSSLSSSPAAGSPQLLQRNLLPSVTDDVGLSDLNKTAPPKPKPKPKPKNKPLL